MLLAVPRVLLVDGMSVRNSILQSPEVCFVRQPDNETISSPLGSAPFHWISSSLADSCLDRMM